MRSFNINDAMPARFFSHACLGVKSEVRLAEPYVHQANLVEKAGNGILNVVGFFPRAVKWVGRQFQDPRVVTVALTALALFVATISFYPSATVNALKATFLVVKLLVTSIPLWSLKLAGYILTCSTIVGYGLRAGGRFANEQLMKAFYGLPEAFKGNPSYLTIDQIRAARAAAPIPHAAPLDGSEITES